MKKFTQVAVAAGLAVALSSSAFAGGYSRAEMPAHDCGVTGLGVSFHQFFGRETGLKTSALSLDDFLGGDGNSVGLDYIVQGWEMGVHMGGVHRPREDSTDATTNIDWAAYLGYRWALAHCLFGSVGLNGDVESGTHTGVDTQQTPWSLGAYVGLAYDPTANLELFMRVNAVQFSEHKTKTSQDYWNFFQNGEVGIAYYFGDIM